MPARSNRPYTLIGLRTVAVDDTPYRKSHLMNFLALFIGLVVGFLGYILLDKLIFGNTPTKKDGSPHTLPAMHVLILVMMLGTGWLMGIQFEMSLGVWCGLVLASYLTNRTQQQLET